MNAILELSQAIIESQVSIEYWNDKIIEYNALSDNDILIDIIAGAPNNAKVNIKFIKSNIGKIRLNTITFYNAHIERLRRDIECKTALKEYAVNFKLSQYIESILY
jgi:hypothetical protein